MNSSFTGVGGRKADADIVRVSAVKRYEIGPAEGFECDLYAPDGEPWCRFGKGWPRCLNRCRCHNPNHGGRSGA